MKTGIVKNGLIIGIIFLTSTALWSQDLYEWAAQGNIPQLRLAIEGGADPFLPNGEGKTPLMVAQEHGRGAAVKFLRSLKKIEFPSGSLYIGQMKKGREHGWGVYEFYNGSRYAGNFRQGRFEGLGYWHYSTGRRHAGEFKDNQFQGKNVAFNNKDLFYSDAYGETLVYRAVRRRELTKLRLLIERGATLDLAVCLKPHLVSSESATTLPPPPGLGLCIVFSP